MITITVRPGKLTPEAQMWEAVVDGTVVATARQPFFAAARALLKAGVDPSTLLQMKHLGSEVISMRSTVGRAAGLTVKERQRGSMSIERFEEHPTYHKQAEQ